MVAASLDGTLSPNMPETRCVKLRICKKVSNRPVFVSGLVYGLRRFQSEKEN